MSAAGVEYAKLGPLREALAEAARTDESNADLAVKRFVELRPGHEDTLRARQHHLITGRRGTGKSTLLHVARAHLRQSGAPVAVIDMEKFKNRPFPDVLIEILIKLLDELRPSIRLKSLHSFASLPSDILLHRKFNVTRGELKKMLNDPQAWSRTVTRSQGRSSATGVAGKLRAGGSYQGLGGSASANASHSSSTNATVTESAEYEELKIERLQQLASRFSAELSTLLSKSSGDRAAVFIDDFYYVRLADQPVVLDYLKTVVKGTGIWLKVGGVGERMRPFEDGDPAIGMQLNQDIHPLPIDVTLDDFGTAQRFLERMMDGVLKPLGLTTAQLFTETARSRMVLACGGAVARDYITLTEAALDAAVERLNKKQAPVAQTLVNVQAEDVNSAARKRANKKEDEELRLDAGDDASRLRDRWRNICDFVREQESTAFVLVRQQDLDDDVWGPEIRQLENLRLLHRIRDTVPNTPNWRGVKCVVYLVDLGQLTVKRLQTGIPSFWESTSEFDKLRRAEWVYAPNWRAKMEEKKPDRNKFCGRPSHTAADGELDDALMLFENPSDLD